MYIQVCYISYIDKARAIANRPKSLSPHLSTLLLKIMNNFNLTNSASVFQYLLEVTDLDGDVQNLTAAFTSVPSSTDISDYLSGWTKSGYSLSSPPQLIKAC